MPVIWFALTEEVRERLRKYQWRWHRKKLGQPDSDEQAIKARGILEDVDEIDQIMRKPPQSRRALND